MSVHDTQPCRNAGEHLLAQRHTEDECPAAQLDTDEGQAMHFALELVSASMDANYKTIDTLLDMERERRQQLESLIEETLELASYAWGGTAREYEKVLDNLRRGVYGRKDDLLARHQENVSL